MSDKHTQKNTQKERLSWKGTIVISKKAVAKWINDYCTKNGIEVSEEERNRNVLTEQEFNELIEGSTTYKEYLAIMSDKNEEEHAFPCEWLKPKYRKTIISYEKSNYIPFNVFGVPPYEVQIDITYKNKNVKWDKLWKEMPCMAAQRVREIICKSVLEYENSTGEIAI